MNHWKKLWLYPHPITGFVFDTYTAGIQYIDCASDMSIRAYGRGAETWRAPAPSDKVIWGERPRWRVSIPAGPRSPHRPITCRHVAVPSALRW